MGAPPPNPGRAIVGCGTIGLFAVAVARAMGANYIIGVEPMENHAEMARRLGADVVLRPNKPAAGAEESHLSDPELTQQIRKLTDGVGVDVALEMTGINSSVNNAVHAVRRGGDVILFGLKSGDAVIQSFDRLIVDGISLHSVVGRRIFETWHITRHLLESRDPNIHDLDLGGDPEPRRGDDVRLPRLRRRLVPEGDLDVSQGRHPLLAAQGALASVHRPVDSGRR